MNLGCAQETNPCFDNMIPSYSVERDIKLSDKPRIDAITIMDFDILDIRHLDSLCKAGIACCNRALKYAFFTKAHEPYTEVKLYKKDLFDTLTYRTNKHGEKAAYMSISIGDPTYHNLYCYTIDQYKARLDMIKTYLDKEYGIVISFERARYHKMEINKTFLLPEECMCYQRAMVSLFDAFPKALKLRGEAVHYSDTNSDGIVHHRQSLKRSSGDRGMDVKLYDKGEQLKQEKDTIIPELDGRCMRFEITLKHQQKIRRTFGTDYVNEITDEQIQLFYYDFVTKNVVDAVDIWDKRRLNKIRSIVDACLEDDNSSFIEHILLQIADAEIQSGVPLILDAVELLEIIGMKRPFSCRQSKYSTKQRIIRTCEQHIPSFASRDDCRVRRLVEFIAK